MLWLCWENGKLIANYYIGVILGYTILGLYWDNGNELETRVYIGIVEHKMETAIWGLGLQSAKWGFP